MIPSNDRNKYRCCVCGESPVKYSIPTYNPLEDEDLYELPYCNKCALVIIGQDATIEREDNRNETLD